MDSYVVIWLVIMAEVMDITLRTDVHNCKIIDTCWDYKVSGTSVTERQKPNLFKSSIANIKNFDYVMTTAGMCT